MNPELKRIYADPDLFAERLDKPNDGKTTREQRRLYAKLSGRTLATGAPHRFRKARQVFRSAQET